MKSSTLRGIELLETPLLNKATAFSLKEREQYGLMGLLPPHVDDIELQLERAYKAFKHIDDDLERHIYLRSVQDVNEVLFYRLIIEHITEMMPLIYTPVVGLACQQFSEIYRRSRGLFIAYPERDQIDKILDNSPIEDVKVIVVTDGERILGLGDQGAGGMGIPIGKLSLYTACGGINPANTLPIVLDVGTNNTELQDDPLYIGWRHARVTGDDYYNFVDTFVQAVKRKFPNALLQFEDFARQHAEPLLEKYRDQLCTFNDDIQGTAAVTVATVLSGARASNKKLSDYNVVMFGAGSAGCGIAEMMVHAMINEGLPEAQARAQFFMIDRYGLIHDQMKDLTPVQQKLAQPFEKVKDWASDGKTITLEDAVKNAKAGILVGVSGQPNTFTESIVKAMCDAVERPIIFPLSNPTSRSEALPSDLIAWSDGKAMIATGSPFDPVKYKNKHHVIAQCNNSYIFPAMGLGILTAGAKHVSDKMFMAAAIELSKHAPILSEPEGSLLPDLEHIRETAKDIGLAVAKQAVEDGVAPPCDDQELAQKLAENHWYPAYPAGY